LALQSTKRPFSEGAHEDKEKNPSPYRQPV
jgi:hypothetical protein